MVAQFKEQLETLLRGIELMTKDLRGACDQCLHLYDEKEKRRLQPLLSQIT